MLLPLLELPIPVMHVLPIQERVHVSITRSHLIDLRLKADPLLSVDLLLKLLLALGLLSSLLVQIFYILLVIDLRIRIVTSRYHRAALRLDTLSRNAGITPRFTSRAPLS